MATTIQTSAEAYAAVNGEPPIILATTGDIVAWIKRQIGPGPVVSAFGYIKPGLPIRRPTITIEFTGQSIEVVGDESLLGVAIEAVAAYRRIAGAMHDDLCATE